MLNQEKETQVTPASKPTDEGTPITDGNSGIVTNAIGEKLEAVPSGIARQLSQRQAGGGSDGHI